MDQESGQLIIRESPSGWTVVGEIDASTAPALGEAFTRLPGGSGTIVLDVSQVAFIDSSGLRVLIALAGRANDVGRSVALDRPSTNVVRLLEITGLAELFRPADEPTTP